jgi:hypothetical protein
MRISPAEAFEVALGAALTQNRKGNPRQFRIGKLLQNMSQPCRRAELGFQIGELQPQFPDTICVPSRRRLTR